MHSASVGIMNFSKQLENIVPVLDYFSGTSGLVLPVPNKQFFPEEFKSGSRLSYYASLFNSIEINSSFYKIPMAKTVANWSATVPDNFKFTFKLYKEITHSRAAFVDKPLIKKFIDTIDHVDEKKGCLLIQFPSTAVFDFDVLYDLLFYISELNDDGRWTVCVEFRDHKWYSGPVFSLLKNLNFPLVIHDMPKSATPIIDGQLDTIYVRFHGPMGDYRGSYSTDVLNEWAKRISGWLTENKKVFVYFNNTIGDALKNLQTLNAMITKRKSTALAQK